MGLCTHAVDPPHLGWLSMSSVNAFGSSWQQGLTTKVEGPWVAPIYTASFLFAFSYFIYIHGRKPQSSLLHSIMVFYAFATAMVEVCRVVWDANRFSFVFAALHNLGEWGIIIHLLVGREKVSFTWPFALLWILFIANLVLFLPDFLVAALSEQITGIWCDWLLITCFALRLHETKDNPALKKVFTFGLAAAVMHMAEILPLVALLTGFVKAPSLPTSFVISFTSPITFYLYSQFALSWEALLGEPNDAEAEPMREEPEPSGADTPRGRTKQKGKAAVRPKDLSPINLHAINGASSSKVPGESNSPYLAQSRRAATLAKVLGGCFLLGLGTVVLPRFAASPCLVDTLKPLPQLPQVEPLCASYSYVAGNTKIVAKPGKVEALRDMLLSVPTQSRLEEGNLDFTLAFEPPSTFHISDSWTSLRTLYKRLATSPVDIRTFYSPQYQALTESTTLEGPFHPMVPCSVAAQQPRLQSLSFETDLDAPLACVWKTLDDFSQTGYIEGTLSSQLVSPLLRNLTFFYQGSKCSVLEARQHYPPVPAHTLRYHTVSGCWTDAALGGDLEVGIDTLTVEAGPASSQSKLTLQLEVAAKTLGRSVAVYEVFSEVGQKRLPFVKAFFEKQCSKK